MTAEPLDLEALVDEAAEARTARYARRRAWLAQAAVEHAEARRYGLRRRHADKLARSIRTPPRSGAQWA